MSTLTVSNVSDGSLSIPTTYVTNGSAKAWVNFDGTGTIAARDSLNVSSLTDNGTGVYTVNYTSAFASANYVVGGASVAFSGGADARLIPWGTQALPTTTATAFGGFNFSGSADDIEYAMVSIHGDLA
jgi:hypothetical protein